MQGPLLTRAGMGLLQPVSATPHLDTLLALPTRAEPLETRATGLNRIKGRNVQIN